MIVGQKLKKATLLLKISDAWPNNRMLSDVSCHLKKLWFCFRVRSFGLKNQLFIPFMFLWADGMDRENGVVWYVAKSDALDVSQIAKQRGPAHQ